MINYIYLHCLYFKLSEFRIASSIFKLIDFCPVKSHSKLNQERKLNYVLQFIMWSQGLTLL